MMLKYGTAARMLYYVAALKHTARFLLTTTDNVISLKTRQRQYHAKSHVCYCLVRQCLIGKMTALIDLNLKLLSDTLIYCVVVQQFPSSREKGLDHDVIRDERGWSQTASSLVDTDTILATAQ